MNESLEAFDDLDWSALLDLAFKEDRVASDASTRLCQNFLRDRVSAETEIRFVFLSREEGVFCGARLFEHLQQSHGWTFESHLVDGDMIRAGTCLSEGRAPWAKLLSQERSVLNLLQMLSGVATETRHFAEIVNGAYESWSSEDKERFPRPRLYHTRKTLPGLRAFQVYAACVGGAERHRLHLADRVMLKDNHKLVLEGQGLDFVDLFNWAREQSELASDLWLIEVDSPNEALRLNAVGAKHLLLDNFSSNMVRDILPALNNVQSVEVSGGLRRDTLAEYVMPGVHRLSVGALTHSARSIDISLDFSLSDTSESQA
jgi:nicotinate-nucleotide pyrophosphorylase (carboxylating)